MSTSRYAAARPKRAGEDFARHHHAEVDQEGANKKPRFDIRNPSALAPDAREEDAVLDADVIGKSGAAVKRNAVNLEGYDSDSENDEFDARAQSRKTGNVNLLQQLDNYGQNGKGKGAHTDSNMEDDEDMFADLQDEFADGDEDEGQPGKGKKGKAVTFMDADDIVGAESKSKSGGHVSGNFALDPKGKLSTHAMDDQESSEDESDAELARLEQDVDEEVGAGGLKGKSAPRIEAYNMKAEEEEGRFDSAGNFVRKAADPDAIHDNWLEGVSKKEMKKAAEAHEKREAERRQKRIDDDAMLLPDILASLILQLEKGETVLEALARLGRGQKKEKKIPKWKLKKQKQANDDMDVDEPRHTDDPEQVKIKESVDKITAAADRLLTRGQTDVYEQEREMLIRQYRRETGEDWIEPQESTIDMLDDLRPTKMWEYKWSDGRDNGTIQGPFEGAHMVAWQDAGYFGEGVEFRRAGEQGDWSRVVEFL